MSAHVYATGKQEFALLAHIAIAGLFVQSGEYAASKSNVQIDRSR